MTPDEFASALAEFAPDDTKVIMTSTSDTVVFSAIPRNKDSESLPERHFFVAVDDEIFKSATTIDDVGEHVLEALFPEAIAFAEAENDRKLAELSALERKSKERVAEKIETASRKTGARFKREIK